MTTTRTTLTDDDVETRLRTTAGDVRLAGDDADGTDADGTDGDDADGTDGDDADGDATDVTDGDDADGQDA